jgi:hypothetical protein
LNRQESKGQLTTAIEMTSGVLHANWWIAMAVYVILG